MSNNISWGELTEILPGLSFSRQADSIFTSSYYKTAFSIFNYLSKDLIPDREKLIDFSSTLSIK